jgi:hypothetical protein
MAFKLKDLMITLLPPAGAAEACPTASAPEARFCPTASAIDPRLCPLASVRVVYCPPASLPVLVLPAPQFCPTASAGFCPTASAEAAAEGACPTASAPAESALGPEGLAALKQQLQQALAQVEEQERALEASYRPQTLAEAEELEARLREALEELQQHKEDLKQR